MVAVRDISALETILVERAAASGPKLAHPAVCVECLASVDISATFITCGPCGLPFCSAGCRALRRLHTNKECALFARSRRKIGVEELAEDTGVLASVTAARLLSLREEEPEVFERVDMLMDNMDRIR